MDSVKEFNHSLNSTLKMDEKDVQNFRNEINKIFEKVFAINKQIANQILTIGAGKINDFSLPFLLDNSKTVCLTDIDYKTVSQAVDDILNSKEDFAKVSIIDCEYTGFSKFGFFELFTNELLQVDNFGDIDKIINTKLNLIKEYLFLDEYFSKCDLVYVSPIYTQLVYQQVLRECSVLRSRGYKEYLLKYIEDSMLQEMIGVIKRFNSNLVKLLTDDGTLIIVSDILQMEVGSNFEKKVREVKGSNEGLEGIYQEYIDKYGVGLGDFGLLDLDDKINDIFSKWLIWPFSSTINFVVKVKVYKKLNIGGGLL